MLLTDHVLNLTEGDKLNYSGVGICTDEEEDRSYVGNYLNGKEHGIGMQISRNGEHKCASEFKHNNVHGIGIKLYNKQNEIYCGEYKNNKRNGVGYWKLPTGAIFVGNYENHQPKGFGMMITWDKLKFIGYVTDWYSEKGKWYDQEDNEIDIEEAGYFSNGSKYVGEIKKGLMHGQGTLTSPAGEKYVGEFKHGQRNGQGTFTDTNGKELVGEFRDGEFIG